MSRVPSFLCGFLALLLLSQLPGVARPDLSKETWSGLNLGPHAVGFRLEYLRDQTRTVLPDTVTRARATSARTIPVRIWYPAGSSAGRLSFNAIVRGMVGRRPAPPIAAPLLARTLSIHGYAARKYAGASGIQLVPADTAGLVAQAMQVRTAANSAEPTRHRYPIVVFAGGTAHSLDENVALWEYLASFGYLVAAFPSVAAEEDTSEAYLPADATGLETMTRDLECVLTAMRNRPDADAGPAVAMGFSFGGAAALVAAARRGDIGGVVGLDPSFIAARHLQTIRSSPLFDPARLTVPLLEFHRADTTVDLALVRDLSRSDRISIEVSGLDHVDFNSYVLLYAPLIERRGGNAARDSALAVKAATYRVMVGTIRALLDSTLGRRSLTDAERQALSAAGPMWASVPHSTLQAHHWAPDH